MKIFFLLIFAFNIWAAPPTDPSKFWVYFIAGQSQNDGLNKRNHSDSITTPGIWMLDENYNWVAAREPMGPHNPINIFTYGGAGDVGPGYAFAKDLLPTLPAGIEIGLVQRSLNGVSVESWMKDSAINGQWGPGYDCYDSMMVTMKRIKTICTIKGVLWTQGETESEAGALAYAQSYTDSLKHAIDSTRKDIGLSMLPYVISEISHTMSAVTYPYAETVNVRIENSVNKIKYCTWISSVGLTAGADNVHWDTTSERKHGVDFSKAMQGLQNIIWIGN